MAGGSRTDDEDDIEHTGCSHIQDAWRAVREFQKKGGDVDDAAVSRLADFIRSAPRDTLASRKNSKWTKDE